MNALLIACNLNVELALEHAEHCNHIDALDHLIDALANPDPTDLLFIVQQCRAVYWGHRRLSDQEVIERHRQRLVMEIN